MTDLNQFTKNSPNKIRLYGKRLAYSVDLHLTKKVELSSLAYKFGGRVRLGPLTSSVDGSSIYSVINDILVAEEFKLEAPTFRVEQNEYLKGHSPDSFSTAESTPSETLGIIDPFHLIFSLFEFFEASGGRKTFIMCFSGKCREYILEGDSSKATLYEDQKCLCELEQEGQIILISSKRLKVSLKIEAV